MTRAERPSRDRKLSGWSHSCLVSSTVVHRILNARAGNSTCRAPASILHRYLTNKTRETVEHDSPRTTERDSWMHTDARDAAVRASTTAACCTKGCDIHRAV